MQECKVNRLLLLSTALLFSLNHFIHKILTSVAIHTIAHAKLMEETICKSNPTWAIARIGFLNNHKTLDYQFFQDLPKKNVCVLRCSSKFSFNRSREKRTCEYHYRNISTQKGSALVVFYSNNLESTLIKIKKANGQVIKEIFEFPRGRKAHFSDPIRK